MATTAEAGAKVNGARSTAVLIAVVASVLGWALDLFDRFILLYVTTTVGQLFFPSQQQLMFFQSRRSTPRSRSLF